MQYVDVIFTFYLLVKFAYRSIPIHIASIILINVYNLIVQHKENIKLE